MCASKSAITYDPCLPDVARAVVPEHTVQEIVGEGGVFASADQEKSLLVRHSGRLLHESEGQLLPLE